MANILLGYAPTRRSIFSAPAAEEYADLTRNRLLELGIQFVDIDDIVEDGLLHDEADRLKIEESCSPCKKYESSSVDLGAKR